MQIKEYEVIVNEKNGTCGIVVNLDDYEIGYLLKKPLQYEVIPEENKLRVFTEDGAEILFVNLDKNLIYYAFKTINLTIFGGRPQQDFEVAIAVLV